MTYWMTQMWRTSSSQDSRPSRGVPVVPDHNEVIDDRRWWNLGHAELEVWNPIAPRAIESGLDALGSVAGLTALDIGCGRATLAVRLAERGASVVAYDASPYAINLARATTAHVDDRVHLLLADRPPRGRFDVIVCLGSSDAISPTAVAGAFAEIRKLVVADCGKLLFGDGYWRCEPAPAFIEEVGNEWVAATHMCTLDRLVGAAETAGFQILKLQRSSGAQWESYEHARLQALLKYVAHNKSDPDRSLLAKHARRSWQLFQSWGRDSFGFALFSCRVTG
jgi:cyclopropane fatty-acyl-phospholipid synthase-like methyltransferase